MRLSIYAPGHVAHTPSESPTVTDTAASVRFGGPDREPRALRNLVAAAIAAVPSGGRIHWATYYFRDRQLALALVEARGRGVDERSCWMQNRAVGLQIRAVEEMVSGAAGLGAGFTASLERKVIRAGTSPS